MTTESIEKYPIEVQEAIKRARVMTHDDLVKYFDNKIEMYRNISTQQYGSWAKDFIRLYQNKKVEVLKKFDETGFACFEKDCNHYGHGFDCEDIDVYLYTDGTYKVEQHSYSAY